MRRGFPTAAAVLVALVALAAPAQALDTDPAPLQPSAETVGPVDLSVQYMAGWLGPGSPVMVYAVVINEGDTASSGHTLDFAPETGTDRQVTAAAGCTPSQGGGFRCTGGALQPGEQAMYSFRFSLPAEVEAWPPFWVSTVSGAEPDPVAENNRAVFELPDATFVQIDSDIKTRVEDADADGRATPGEKMEVYVHFTNASEYELQEVHVSVTGTIWDHRELERIIAPGEEATVRFDAIVPDLGPDATSGVEARVTARAVGATVDVWSGTLMLIGPYATPNPGGLLGEQLGAAEADEQAALAMDPEQVFAKHDEPAEPGGSSDTVEEPQPAAPPPSVPSVSSGQEPLVEETPSEPSRVAEGRSERSVEDRSTAASSHQRPPTALSTTGAGSPMSTLLTAHLLIAIGVIFAHIGISRYVSRRRVGS